MSNLILPSDLVNGSLYKESKENQLLNSFLEFNPLNTDIIESYHDFIYRGIADRLAIPFYDMYGKRAYFNYVRYERPRLRNSESLMFPLVARELDANYEAEMIGNLIYEEYADNDVRKIGEIEVSLGYIPVMIGSDLDNAEGIEEDVGECPNDVNGYFIMGGNEYVVMCQQQLRYNTFFVFPARDKETYYGGTLKNLTPHKSITNAFNMDDLRIIRVTTDSIQDFEFINANTGTKSQRRGINFLHLSKIIWNKSFDETIADVLDKADSRYTHEIKEILDYGKLEEFDNNYNWLSHINNVNSGAMNVFQRRRKGREILVNEFLPNAYDINDKYNTFNYMIIKYIMTILGHYALDDMDSWSCSQATSPGMHLMSFFNSQWRLAMGIKQTFEKSSDLIARTKTEIATGRYKNPMQEVIIPFDSIRGFVVTKLGKNFLSDQITKGFLKSTFNLNSGDSTDNSTQLLKRASTISAKAHINRIIVRSTNKGGMMLKRMVHMSQAGYVCVADTPEGEQCGLVKAKAIGARISSDKDSDLISIKLNYLTQDFNQNLLPVFLNYEFIGYGDEFRVMKDVRDLRMESLIDMGITLESLGIFINITPGRLVRPLLIVDDGELLIEKYDLWGRPFEELLKNKIIEYIDAREQDYGFYISSKGIMRQLLIASTIPDIRENTTHCELDPSAILSISASIIPLTNHNQGPRVSYQCNMGNQALGLFVGNNRYRMDAEAKLLAFPSRPILTTQSAKFLGLDTLPAGNNIMLAIGTFEGFNQEDAIVVNKSAIDRGLFMTTIYKTAKLEINTSSRSKSFVDTVSPPKIHDNIDRRRNANFSKLDKYGLIKIGSLVEDDDCMACAYRTTNVKGQIKRKDISLYAGSDHVGMIVDRVLYSEGYKDTKIVSIKLRRYKKLAVGDKISSRSAQKSIIGKVVASEDMPYTESGEIPTMIMNPLAIPSRMTIAQILEMLLGKAALLSGSRINGTMMTNLDINKFKDILEAYGYSTSGEEYFFDGYTGRRTTTSVYYGPVYYQALTHQVDYKIQSRQTGPIERQTKQAVSGRAKGGGIKVGNMETSALIAHGQAMNVLQDRLCSSGGKREVVSCYDCGNVVSATTHVTGSEYKCTKCVNPDVRMIRQEVTPVTMHFKYSLASGGLRLNFRS